MKRLVASLTALLLCVSAIMAQQQQQQQRANGNMNSAEFSKFQVEVITRQLNLEESKTSAFTELYNEYSQKMNELQPRPQKRGGERGEGQQSAGQQSGEERSRPNNTERTPPSDKEVESQIIKSFELAEMSNALKREYYYKFKAILTPQQILKMYNVERQLRERMLSESARRTGNENPVGRNQPQRR